MGRAEHKAREDHMRGERNLLFDLVLTVAATVFILNRLEGIRHPNLGTPPAQQVAHERPATTVAALP